MRRRRRRLPLDGTAAKRGALGCFDNDLCIRRHLFEDAVTICNIEAEALLEVSSERAGMLTFGGHGVDVARVLDWLTPFTNESSYTYYIHHHDNIVEELVLFDLYERDAFCRYLHLFHTHLADEGGANYLGVVDLGQAWVLVLENNNQGGFRFDFFGPADMCGGLRSHLKTKACR